MADDRCETTSGQFRCMHGVGHGGPCEAQAAEYALPGGNRRIALDRPTLKRIEILEVQVKSLQMAMPKGIPEP